MPEFALNLIETPFDLSYTLESGQVFRWQKREEWWYGVVGLGAVKVKQEQNSLVFASSTVDIDPTYVRDYFGLNDDLSHILSSVTRDRILAEAIQRFYGLRLIHQPIWECLVSFTISTNMNIPRIAKTIASLCERFGEPFEFEGRRYNLFPRPEALAEAEAEQLSACGLGYRTRFVKWVAQAVYEEWVDLSELRVQGYEKARELLMGRILNKKSFLGIGPKVADCVLLFSCGKYEAFPIDVWISKALAYYYPGIIEPRLIERLEMRAKRRSSLSLRDYDLLSAAARAHFGRYAGYAQQYLYLLSRTKGSFST